MKVLFIGSANYQERIANIARKQAWNMTSVTDPNEALEFMHLMEFMAILVVVGRKQTRGLQAIKMLSKGGFRTPIIAMLNGDDLQGRIKSLESGAVFSMPDNIDPTELHMRLHALARREKQLSTGSIEIGGVSLDPFAMQIQGNGKPLSLTRREFQLLELLFVNKGKVISRDGIMDHLYGGEEEPMEKIVDVLVCKLRAILKQLGGEQEIIRTVWGAGYIVDDWNPLQNAGFFASRRAA